MPSSTLRLLLFLSLCSEKGRGRLRCCVHILQLWFCSHLNVISKVQPIEFMRRNRVKIIVALNLSFTRDITIWLGYLFSESSNSVKYTMNV